MDDSIGRRRARVKGRNGCRGLGLRVGLIAVPMATIGRKREVRVRIRVRIDFGYC